MASSRLQALHGFRRLLRARRVLFEGDARAMAASWTELSEHFRANKNATDPAQIQELLQGIDEVEDMMRNNFVQGALTEQGTYAAKIPAGKDGEELRSLTTDDLEKMAKEAECGVTVNKYSPNREMS